MKPILLILLAAGMVLLCGCPQETQGGTGSGGNGGYSQCTDSDGGKDIFTLGTVDAPSGTGTDRCIDEGSMVMEYYCNGSWKRSEDIPCPEGFSCESGRCAGITCFDSDGGRNTGEKGTVNYNKTQYTDNCLDEKWVREFSCSGRDVLEEAIECGFGEACIQGECAKAPECTDSDNGENIYVAGITRYGSAQYEDECVGYNVVFEYSCRNGSVESKQIMCAEGEECEDGICIEGVERECRDTDDGKIRYDRGTVTYWVNGQKLTETDKCYDQYSVLEVWCTDSGSIGFGVLECYDDDWCEDGECTGG